MDCFKMTTQVPYHEMAFKNHSFGFHLLQHLGIIIITAFYSTKWFSNVASLWVVITLGLHSY